MARGISTSAVVLSASRTLERREVRSPEPPPSGGWLRVEACGMCGSDWNWYANRPIATPMILGHEIVGTVTALWGELADRGDLAIGDRIVLEEAVPCRVCHLCRSGRHRMCRNSGRYGGNALTTTPGLWGGYAQDVFLDPRATVHRVPDSLDSALAPLFIPVSNGLSWLGSTARLMAGESVVVLGPGQHGLATVAAARHLGAGPVIAVGRSGDERRLAAARALGADLVVDLDAGTSERALREIIMDCTHGLGADIVVDTTPGATASVGLGVAMAAVSGRIVVVGNKAGSLSPLDTDAVFRSELSILGVAARESRAVDAALAWLAAAPETFEPFGSMVIGLDDVESAMLALGGETGTERPLHAVIVPDDGTRTGRTEP